MADILLNVDGTQKVFKNTVHLAANTESGGKAVYTEESETTTAYLLTDPTGEMPTFDGGSKGYFSEDNKYWCGAVNAAEGVITAPFVGYLDRNTNEYYIYTGTAQTLTDAVMKSFNPEWPAGDWKLQAGWNYNRVIFFSFPDVEWVQKHLRENGGIPMSAFAWDTMDEYTKSIFVQTEIAVPKYAQADYFQNDATKPDFVHNRIGGFFLPELSVKTLEWDGELGKLPMLSIGDSYVQLYEGYFYKEHLLGAKITQVDKVGDNDPTTRTYTVTEEMLAELEDIGFGAITGYILIITAYYPGLYVKKLESNSNGVVSTTYPSKIEFAQQNEPVPVPFSKVWLPRDLSIEIATSNNVGGVKNPSSYTESSDDSEAYVNNNGVIKIPHGNKITEAVLYTAQTLSSSEQAQARANLGIRDTSNANPSFTGVVQILKSGESASNTLKGSNKVLIAGTGNRLYADSGEIASAAIFGNSNTIEDPGSGVTTSSVMVIGSDNTLHKGHQFALGLYNTIYGYRSGAIGENNTVRVNDSLAVGSYNTLQGGGPNVAIGDNLLCQGSGALTIGRYNSISGDPIFAIGQGTSDSARKNIFQVNKDGVAYAKALVLESTTANSTKKFKITVDDSGTLKATEVTL